MKKLITVLLSSILLINIVNAEELDNTITTTSNNNTNIINEEVLSTPNDNQEETTNLTLDNKDTNVATIDKTNITESKNLKGNVKTYIASINGVNYETLDEAINIANNNDTIILLNNATTSGINLSKNLTIDGKNYTITFNDKGISLWGITLTFKNVNVNMKGITATPYSEWSWMTICASKNSKLVLNNTTMTLDGNGTETHAIYFTGNNKLELNNSTLEIKNYKEDALEWDGGDGGYNILLDNSSYLSDNNRSGFTGTFTVKTYNSNVDVINSSGNGSNGSNFEFYDSKVNFNNNGSHGLSAGLLTIDNSTVNANNNGANGIHVGGTLKVQNNSIVNIENNKCSISSKWTIPGALYVAGKDSIIDKTTKLTIQNNNGSGIYVHKTGDLKLETGTIINNFAEKLQIGGGIHNAGNLSIDDSVIINNNHAEVSSDDIYNDENANITFGNTHDDWKLNGGYKDKDKTEKDCTDKIDGWYDDNEEKRYNSHDENRDNLYVLEKTSGNYTNKLTLKAAHGLYGNVTVRYIDDEGKELSENIILRGKVDSEYTSSAKEFEYYELIEVKGNKTGKYTLDNQEVIYIYSFVGGIGGDDVDIDTNFPKTGVEDNNLPEVIFSMSSLLLAGTILLKKKFN